MTQSLDLVGLGISWPFGESVLSGTIIAQDAQMLLVAAEGGRMFEVLLRSVVFLEPDELEDRLESHRTGLALESHFREQALMSEMSGGDPASQEIESDVLPPGMLPGRGWGSGSWE